MPPEPAFSDDSCATYVRKCLVFPSNAQDPRVVDMTIRTVTLEDISHVGYNRIVDLVETYGSEYRKIRAWEWFEGVHAGRKHLVYYNMSPKLPLNRCAARMVGINPDELESRLFWRGDIVVMGFDYDDIHSNFIICRDVDTSAMGLLEYELIDAYTSGFLEQELAQDQSFWSNYSSKYFNRKTALSTRITRSHPFWGKDWKRQEADCLDEINELREFSGHRLLSARSYKRSRFNLPGMRSAAILRSLQRFLFSNRLITGLPRLPRELERRIFEDCAINSWETCLDLIPVARRVREWISPILYATVILRGSDRWTQMSATKLNFELFVAQMDSKPPEFYSKHVKNLWISAEAFDRVLSVCTSVENLVLHPHQRTITSVPFLAHPSVSGPIRRLTCTFKFLSPLWTEMPNFQHACFANLTHLHVIDQLDHWNTVGLENLRSLTHLACGGIEEVGALMPRFPTLEYVAICHYAPLEHADLYFAKASNYNRMRVDGSDIRVVWITCLTVGDWKRGAIGRADFWDIVERVVANRRGGTS